eukprot:scaffold148547_cov47-Cyclotella_meneghiniana.AAC.3
MAHRAVIAMRYWAVPNAMYHCRKRYESSGCDTGVPMSAQSAGTRESFRDSKIRFEWISFVSVTSYKS